MNNIQSLHLAVRRWTLSLMLVIGALGLTVSLSAFAPADAFQDPPPPRAQAAAPAPAREPIILETLRLTSGVMATVIEVPAAADAYIASGRPDQNFGDRNLFLGYSLDDAYGAQRMLLRFDLGSIPSNAVVQDARLRLYLIYGTPAGDAPMGTIVRRLASTWGEQTVTWNTEPTWASIRDESSVGTTAGWYEWTITDLTTAWVQETLANQGVEVEGDETVQQRERAFYSRETTTAFYPRLTVTYSVVNDNQPPQIIVNPLPPYSGRDFTVAWSGSDQGTAGLNHYDVQSQIDGGAWVNWQTGVTITSAAYVGVTGHTYAFRARGVDNAGNIELFDVAEAQTIVDALPPIVVINPLPPKVTDATFTVSWSGTDPGGAGIQYYDARYRFNGGVWINWQNTTLATSAEFVARDDGVYEFEARGVDNVNQVEPFTGRSEAWTMRDIEAPFVLPVAWLPLIRR